MTEHRTGHFRAGMAALAALALAPAVFAAPVAAEGWAIFKLDSVDDLAACMSRARRTVSSYIFDHGGSQTGADSWSVYGYDLEPGQQDVVIVCFEAAGGAIDALLVVQSESESEPREQVAEALLRIWDGA
ncbi:MAG: hypothetical protein AUK37_02750 [Rhodobacterales bacterium CG2_30_65_12]|nr:MAG: hypothetical protein AUK37_02750 [Rhodobacterales bacterium CG2_30_65_12]